jgi:hypothetical protein
MSTTEQKRQQALTFANYATQLLSKKPFPLILAAVQNGDFATFKKYCDYIGMSAAEATQAWNIITGEAQNIATKSATALCW